MKQFKFRAWHPENKSMVLFDLERASKDQFTSSEVCALLSNTHSQGKDLMMQFTGLADRAGTEIYEGDIVNSNYYWPDIESVAAIKYDNESMSFIADCPEQDAYKYGELLVIGNIYQNPELLPSPPEAE